MYNTNFSKQIEEFERYLCGHAVIDRAEEEKRAKYASFVPLKSLEILECVEAPNGEWVPKKSLEKTVSK
ncbi:MAG: hypothetical protein WC413_02455 [Candidatus Nanoarchaeia archaeon]